MPDNHYVPRFYLAQFTDPQSLGHEKEEPYLWVADLVRGKVKKRAPVNVAKIAGFYDLNDLPENLLPLEDLYQRIESRTTRLIRRLGSGSLSCVNQEKYNLASFMACQLTRVPGVHERLRHGLEAHFKATIDELFSEDTWLERALQQFNEARSQDEDELPPENVKDALRLGRVKGTPTRLLLMANALHSSLQFLPLLLNMEWTFLLAAAQATFVSGDHPVCLRSPGARRISIDTTSFNNPELEVTFPISPSVLLFAHQQQNRPPQGKLTDSVVHHINEGMLPCLRRYVYSSCKADAEMSLDVWSQVRSRVPDDNGAQRFDPC